MNKLIDYFVERSLFVNLLSVIILVAGIMSVLTLQKEVFPNVDFETIIVRANYPGASAEDVEKLVTISLERKIKEVNGIKEMNAMSGEGYSIIVLVIEPDEETDKVLQDVRDAVESVVDLPSEVDPPMIRKMENKTRPIIKIAISGAEEARLREVSKSLRDRVELLPGIARTEITGMVDQIIDVAVDPNKLIQYDLTLQDIAQALRDRNQAISAGTLRLEKKEMMVRTNNQFESAKDVKNVIIRSNNTGASIKVSELALVEQKLKDNETETRVDGQYSLVLEVAARAKADVLNTTEVIKNKTEDFFKKYITDKEIKFSYIDELGYFVKQRLATLTSNGLTGMLLVFITLTLFLNFRVSVMTSLGAPLAFLVSFMLMHYLGISLNLISMFALILVLGMLVDDSIIVSEHFYQHIEQGVAPREAAKLAAKETIAPVTATILTTMVAFSSLFFISGIMGKFLWPVPAVVMICLIASWIECFFILPCHLADFVKNKSNSKNKQRWYDPIKEKYSQLLSLHLKHYKKTILGFVCLLISAVILLKFVRYELFPTDDATAVVMRIKADVGTPYEVTKNGIINLEKIILNELRPNEFKNIRSVVGSQSPRSVGFSRVGTHYAMIILYLTLNTERERETDQILEAIMHKAKPELADFELSYDKLAGGPPKGMPVSIELSAESINDLKHHSKLIEDKLKSIPGITSTEIDYEEGKKQLQIRIREADARRLNVNNLAAAMEIRRSIEGEKVSEIRKNDEDIEIIIRFNQLARSNPAILDSIYVTNNQGRRIKLSHFAEIVEEPGSFVIRRYNRKRTFSITAEIDKTKITSQEANKQIKPFLDELVKSNSTLNYELTGEAKDGKEANQDFIKALIVSVMIIFLILVAMFSSLIQPIIILSAIPMGMIGVIYTFKLMNLPIGFMALMGIIGLVGVVVNDSIVLVNFINKKMGEVIDLNDAIKQASVSRFRPVILTTFTTVAGLLPIAHAPGGDPFLKPMAISFAYGLLFSTVLTLIFVPCCYKLYGSFLIWQKVKLSSKG
jgi:multidrug efflux pump subunit AcrB